MSVPAKRFWKSVEVRAQDGGFQIALDGRELKTPGKLPLVLPSAALAEAVADEWAGVGERIVPAAMPMTRLANTAVEKLGPMRAQVVEEITRYGGSDLLCYRAHAPVELVARQAQLWDPLLDAAALRHGARLSVTVGVVPITQPGDALAALHRAVDAHGVFGLTALYEVTAISGSLVIGLAALDGQDLDALWRAARLDEDYQAEVWGRDDEADHLAELKRRDFVAAARFHQLLSRARQEG